MGLTTPSYDDVDAASTDTTVDAAATAAGNLSMTPDVGVDLNSELRFHNILYKVVVPVTFGLIIGVGVCGNALVVYITLSCRAMRTTVNLLLLNLAASDVLFLVVAVPFMAYHYAADNWLIGDVACKLSHFVLYAIECRPSHRNCRHSVRPYVTSYQISLPCGNSATISYRFRNI